jgi:hypothetical protein
LSDQRAIVDVVCKTGITNLATEIGALLGQELTCSAVQLEILSKEQLFSDPAREKTILTRIDVTGDQEGDCFLLTRLDTAITLGGTLIMLPEEMIQEQIAAGKLDGEMPDAFGEVANIIAGVFTQAFVDKYPQSIRFVKKTVEELIPSKIDVAGDEPFPPGKYYSASCVLSIADTSLGPVEFIVPTAVFALEETAAETEKVHLPQPEAAPAAAEVVAQPAPVEEPAPAPKKLPAFADAKKLTDVIFKATIGQLGGEMGALLGKDLVCDDLQLEMVKKTDFFSDHCLEKSAMSLVKVSGDRDGCGYLFVQIPDAIILGGTLIMLPEDQIAEQVEKFAFEGESVDAYGEIANILCGGLTQVFLDRYPKQLRFVRTETEVLVPTKLDPDADEPFPEGDYYLASFSIGLEGYQLNRMSLLFPGEIFDLYPGQVDTVATDPAAQTAAAANTAAPVASEAVSSAPQTDEAPIVLLVSERQNEAEPFVEILSASDCSCKVLSFQDDIKTLVQQHRLLGIFLIMSQVSEKGFATAIKLQSLGKPAPPLIFVGPDWTRSTVLRAVKYGARDILMLPATGEEIQEKISHHILKAS